MAIEEEQVNAAENPAAEDEFETAFAEFAKAREGDEQVTEDEPVEVEAADTDEAEAPIEEEEKPEWQVRLEEAEKRASDWEHRYKSDLGRQAALQKKIADLESKLQESAPKSEETRAEYSERMQGLMEDYPEIAQALQEELDRRLGGMKQELSPVFEERQQRERDAAVAQVRDKYPDFDRTVNSQEFIEWYVQQPVSIQRLAGSQDPADAIAMLDYYSAISRPASNPAVQEIREKRNQSLARNVTVRNTAPAPTGDAPDDFEAAFRFYAKQKERTSRRF